MQQCLSQFTSYAFASRLHRPRHIIVKLWCKQLVLKPFLSTIAISFLCSIIILKHILLVWAIILQPSLSFQCMSHFRDGQFAETQNCDCLAQGWQVLHSTQLVGSSVDLLKRGAGSSWEDNGHYCTRFCWIGHTGPSLTSSFLSP